MNRVKDGELARKAIHYTSSLIPMIYYFFLSKKVGMICLAWAVILMLTAEGLRIYSAWWRSVYYRFLGWMTRSHEEWRLTGATYVFISALIVVTIFPKSIAVASLLFLTIGDPSACLVGLAFGKIRLVHKKTLEGTLAFIVGSLLVTGWLPGIPFWILACGAVTGAVVELLRWKVDDNFTIPLISGSIMFLLMLL